MGIMIDHVGAPITIGLAGLLLAAIITSITVFSPNMRRREDLATAAAASD
jgi:hypothetical protein